MRTCNCPACGAEVKFQSAVSVFAVCEYCKSTLVRHDLDIEAIGKMAQLSEDWSPMQLGTQGRYLKTSFSLVGRVRLRWERGSWDEWFCVYDDQRYGWLSEAQGIYHLSFPVENPGRLPGVSEMDPGRVVQLAGKSYQVTDKKSVTCAYSEGELPFPAVIGRASVSVDLTSTKGGFACIDYSDEGVHAYAGEYLEFDDLRFSFLREIDGWGSPG